MYSRSHSKNATHRTMRSMAGEYKSTQQKVWNKTQGFCAYCGVKLLPPSAGTREDFRVDRIVPRSSGGNTTLANLAPCCQGCNCLKRSRSLESFRDVMLHRKLPRCTADHIAHLNSLGITLPPDFPCYPPYLFWYERQGIRL